MKRSLLIFTMIASISGIEVDVYQDMLYGSHDDVLTTNTADSGSHGACDDDSTATWTFVDSLFVSDSFPVSFPGQIIVRGENVNPSPVHTWRLRNKWEQNYGQCYFDNTGHTGSYGPLHDKMTIGLFYRTNQTAQVSNFHDNLEMHCNTTGYAVLQTVGISGRGQNVYVRGHADLSPQVTDTIRVQINKWYWINLHHDGVGGRCKVAVYDPDDWSLVGMEQCTTNTNPVRSYYQIGRTSYHEDYPDNATSTWFAHIMVDTGGVFPLLPDLYVHYASASGTGTWDEALSISTPCALSTANDSVAAGDTVRLLSGTYTTGIDPQNSGTAASPIVYTSHVEDRDSVIIYGITRGILIDGVSHIEIQHITIDSCRYGHTITNGADSNTINQCSFLRDRDTSVWEGSAVYFSSQYNHIYRCKYARWGYGTKNGMLDIGRDDEAADDSAYYNCVEACTLYYGGHHLLLVHSKYNVIKNNVFVNDSGTGADGIYTGYRAVGFEGYVGNSGWNVFINNRIGYTHVSSGVSLRSPHNIVRNNDFFNCGASGLQIVSNDNSDYAHCDSNMVTNNSFFGNGFFAPGGVSSSARSMYIADWGQGDPIGNHIVNNVFYGDSVVGIGYQSVADSQTQINNLKSGNPQYVDTTTDDMLDYATPDLSCQNGSITIDAGAFYTDITSSSGSGTTFTVTDARFFTDGYGWGGDVIQIEGQTDTAVVSDVNYTTNTLVFSPSLTWVQGDSLVVRYDGVGIDQGAHDTAPAAVINVNIIIAR